MNINKYKLETIFELVVCIALATLMIYGAYGYFTGELLFDSNGGTGKGRGVFALLRATQNTLWKYPITGLIALAAFHFIKERFLRVKVILVKNSLH